MSSRKILLLIVTIAIGASTACNYTVGECWRRGEGSAGVGAGPGDSSGVGSSGSGDFGDDPGEQNNEEPLVCNKSDKKEKGSEESPEDTPKSPTLTDPCQQSGAPTMGCASVRFNTSDFKFVTTIAYDGTGVAGGWQEAKSGLTFFRGDAGPAACFVRIGMPLRSATWGVISADTAAMHSAEVANVVTNELERNGGFDLPPGIFCSKFYADMREMFAKQYRGLGATDF
jgi:hypothetical protein